MEEVDSIFSLVDVDTERLERLLVSHLAHSGTLTMDIKMAITPEMGEGIPPHWAAYLAVEDCDDTVARAESLGGKVVVPANDIPGVGRFAFVADPQGAVFGVIKLANPPA